MLFLGVYSMYELYFNNALSSDLLRGELCAHKSVLSTRGVSYMTLFSFTCHKSKKNSETDLIF